MTNLSAFVTAAGLSLLANPPVAWLAHRLGWESHTDRAGVFPAMSGGSVVLLAMTATWGLGAGWSIFLDFRALWLGLAVMFCMGVLDDIVVLKPVPKFCLQLLSASVFVAFLVLEGRVHSGAGAFLIVVWVLGVSNATNLLDNMDGLGAGVGSIAACGLAAVIPAQAIPGQSQLLLVALSGALVGFLAYNFYPARVFLGDSGSHLIGFVLSGMAVYGWLASQPGLHDLLAPALVLIVPVVDTAYVIVARTARGVPFYRGGKDHLSHLLAEQGVSAGMVAIFFYLVTLVGCLAALSLA